MTTDELELPARARRRVTRRLIPYLMFIYLLAYLDRANIGVAKLQMQKDLNFNDAVIGFGAGIFFLGYLLLDIPGSLIVERWSARKWIARIMVSWGLVAALMGFVGTPLFGSFRLATQFYGLRLLLGIAEAGFFPGVIVYLSHWYRLEDRAAGQGLLHDHAAPGGRDRHTDFALDSGKRRAGPASPAGAGCSFWKAFLRLLMGFVTLFYLTDRPHEARGFPRTRSSG